jgi:hypothetical protein
MRVLLSLFAIGLFVQAPPPLEAGFTALWNGKDFTGWRLANPDSFSIENGAIVAHGKAGPGHAFYDGPFRNHSFRNFELKVDVMTRKGSNGGIYMMTEFVEKGWPAKGFEVQVNNTYEKDQRKTGSLYMVSDVNTPPAKDDVWFTEHIVVNGDTITVRVNDVQTVTWTQPGDWPGVKGTPGRRLGPGTVALQAHDPNSTVLYRNIRIKPLD